MFWNKKCLEILLLLCNLHILASDPKHFVISSNFWATFWDITGKCLENLALMQNFGAQTGIMRDVQMVQRGKKKSENF